MIRPPFATPVPSKVYQDLGARSTKAWLEHLPVSNSQVMQIELLSYLRMLNDAQLGHRERLKVLELLREHLLAVQTIETAKLKFRPLPFSKELQQQFELICETWQSFIQGYLIVVSAALADDESAKEFAVFAAERVFHALGRWFLCFYYAYRKVPADGWLLVQQCFFPMLARGWVDRKVKDAALPGEPMGSVTLRQMFAHLILLSQSSPHKLSAKQLAFVDELLFIWRDKLRCTEQPPLDPAYSPIAIAPDKPQLTVVLHTAADAAVAYLFVARDPLLASLARRVKMLRNGEPWDIPALSDQLISAGGVNLLTTLYKHWSERRDRGLPRHGASQEVGVTGDWPTMFAHLTGVPLEKYLAGIEVHNKQLADFQLFGKRDTQTYHYKEGMSVSLPPLEVWSLKDENEGGLGVLGKETEQRWQQLQLVLIKKPAENLLSLGVLRRLLFDDDGQIELGVSLFQGTPTAVVIEPVGVLSLATQGQPGILIPAVIESLQVEMLLVPSGALMEGRTARLLMDDASREVRLTHIEIRGFNFDAFQIASVAPD